LPPSSALQTGTLLDFEPKDTKIQLKETDFQIIVDQNRNFTLILVHNRIAMKKFELNSVAKKITFGNELTKNKIEFCISCPKDFDEAKPSEPLDESLPATIMITKTKTVESLDLITF